MPSPNLQAAADAISGAQPISLPDYWGRLDAFDWGYEWSDDHSVYEAGRKRHEELSALATLSPAHKQMFKAFEAHEKARNYGTNPLPARPERPQ